MLLKSSYPARASESGMSLSCMKLDSRKSVVDTNLLVDQSHPSRCCFFCSISSDSGNIDRTGHRPICTRKFLPYASLPDQGICIRECLARLVLAHQVKEHHIPLHCERQHC